MIKNQISRDKISIHHIGKLRFWFGISAGIFTSIMILEIVNYTRETFRYFTSLSSDLLILNESELNFYNYFYSCLATVLGLSITIWFWMSNFNHNNRNSRIYKRLSGSSALVIFWIVLMLVARFGSTLLFTLLNTRSYEPGLNPFNNYSILFVLLPVVIFLQNWYIVRLVYRSGKWILISFIICALLAFLLNLTLKIDQEKLNQAYYSRFEKDFLYIDQEISKAKADYNIDFSKKTIQTLKKWHTENAIEQVIKLKSAFASENPVSLDTIILEKITIRNYKKGRWYFYSSINKRDWQFALPNEVLRQIYLTKSDTNKTKELFELLQEQINLVNLSAIEKNDYESLTETEKRRIAGAKHKIPKILVYQLKDVRESLIRSGEFMYFTNGLDSVNTKYFKYRRYRLLE